MTNPELTMMSLFQASAAATTGTARMHQRNGATASLISLRDADASHHIDLSNHSVSLKSTCCKRLVIFARHLHTTFFQHRTVVFTWAA
jgi:hypothetical protein